MLHLLYGSLLLVTSLLTLARADADFWDVRTSLDKDRSGKGGDPKDKYFRKLESMLPLTRSDTCDLQTSLRMFQCWRTLPNAH